MVTPKAWAKNDHLFNKPASDEDLSNISKSDLSRTAKCDQIRSNDRYKFGHT
jgi:hypothetical protein